MRGARKKVSPVTAFLPLVNRVIPSLSFRHQGQFGGISATDINDNSGNNGKFTIGVVDTSGKNYS
jgi:hypothetical protein